MKVLLAPKQGVVIITKNSQFLFAHLIEKHAIEMLYANICITKNPVWSYWDTQRKKGMCTIKIS